MHKSELKNKIINNGEHQQNSKPIAFKIKKKNLLRRYF